MTITKLAIVSAFIAFIVAMCVFSWALFVHLMTQRGQRQSSQNNNTLATSQASTSATTTGQINIPSVYVQDDSKINKFEEQSVVIDINRLIGTVIVDTYVSGTHKRELVDSDIDDDIETAAGTISTTVHFGNEIVILVQSNDKVTAIDTDIHPSNSTTTTTTDTTCVICLCDFLHGDSVYRNDPDSTCHHMFHEICIRKWIRRQQQQQQQSNTTSIIRPVCPCCRYPIYLPTY